MEIGQLSEKDICVVIPASQASGEPGDPLSTHVIILIDAMVSIGYAPVDFGQADDNAIELWFMSRPCQKEARDTADHFIRMNGDV